MLPFRKFLSLRLLLFYICFCSLLINTRLVFISYFVSVPLRKGHRGLEFSVRSFDCTCLFLHFWLFALRLFCIFEYLYYDFWFFVDFFVACIKGVLENFTKFTGKHLCWGLFFNKVAGLGPESLLKKHSNTGAFHWIWWNFLRILLKRTALMAASVQKTYFCQFFVKKEVLNLFSTCWFN